MDDQENLQQQVLHLLKLPYTSKKNLGSVINGLDLLERVHNSAENLETRVLAGLKALGQPGITILKKLLFHQDEQLRCDAVWALISLDTFAYLPYILPLLHDRSHTVRWSVSGILRDVPDDRVVDALMEVILEDSDAAVRYVACDSLRIIGNARAISALEKVEKNDVGQDSEGRNVKGMATWAIKEILQNHEHNSEEK